MFKYFETIIVFIKTILQAIAGNFKFRKIIFFKLQNI